MDIRRLFLESMKKGLYRIIKSFDISPELMQISYINVNYNYQPNL